MKYRRLALVIFASAFALVRAQDDENRQRPPTEIPDFSNLDEYIYEPKSTVQLSFRHLSGPKTQFSGSGTIIAPEGVLPDPNATDVTRSYHDGTVSPDGRVAPVTDNGGNPIIDPQSGVPISVPVPPDGKTNTWSYTDQRQVDEAPAGYIAFHSYSADVFDTGSRAANGRSTNGMDLAVLRDMGKLFNTRFSWKLMAGMSVNDIVAQRSDHVSARLNTLTDYYQGYGANFPSAPYTAPSTTTTTVTDATGNVQTVSVDTTVLIGSTPAASTSSSAVDDTSVVNSWKVHGAYYTFRGGPQLIFPFTDHLHVTVSLGLAMVYAGTNYSVTQTLTTPIGADIPEFDQTAAYKLLPGVYADASLDYDLTDKTGFFAGAVYQTAGTYTQAIHSTTAQYVTKIDLSNQSGFRAGLSIRF